jgi:hypothetical protein
MNEQKLMKTPGGVLQKPWSYTNKDKIPTHDRVLILVELPGTRSLRSLVQRLHDCEQVRIGNLSCELPPAILTLSGQYPDIVS